MSAHDQKPKFNLIRLSHLFNPLHRSGPPPGKLRCTLLLAAIITLLGVGQAALAQVVIGSTTPNPNAILKLETPSGNTMGFLVPTLTTAQQNSMRNILNLSCRRWYDDFQQRGQILLLLEE